MIKNDRIELNDRFVQAFQLLEQRGMIVKNDRSGKGVGDVAEKVLGNKAYGHIIRAFLNNDSKRVIDYNETWMLHGIGSPFGFDAPDRTLYADRAPRDRAGNILFTTISAFAGTTLGAESAEDNAYFNIPGVSGSGLVAFPITGNSMEPIIKNQDIIVCREVENIADIKDNDIYAIKSNGSVWVKYVQKIVNNRGRLVRLKMISANYFDHDPFEEDVNESTRLFRVIKKISAI
jgi:Peptidase S24-like